MTMSLGIETALVAFAAAALAILVIGPRLVDAAEALAEHLGIHQLLVGAVAIGATTSLPGIVTTVGAAARGDAELAIGNAIGGIAAQTAFLALADFGYRRANLEHASATSANLAFGALLLALLPVPLVAAAAPDVALGGIHPASLLIVLFYVWGLSQVDRSARQPMWRPTRTSATVEEEAPETRRSPNSVALWLRFVVFAGIAFAAGYALSLSAPVLADATGLSHTVAGAFGTAIVTSLPELVTAIAAVRRGALALAVGNILGGNAFDLLFISFADFADMTRTIYAAWLPQHTLIVAATVFMVAILLLGLIRRQRHGPLNIGFESAVVLAGYALSVVLVAAI